MFYARMFSEPFIDSFISVDESVLLVGSTNNLEHRQSLQFRTTKNFAQSLR